MFGTLKPGFCGLLPDDKLTFRRLYCGLCKGLGTHIGQVSRVLVHHDIVLYAAAVDAMQRDGGAHGSCRCPVAPHQFRPILEPQSTAVKAATGIQVLLADQWLADQQVDGRWFAWLLRPTLSRPARLARRLMRETGLDSTDFEDLHRRQQAVEADPGVSPEQAAEPTAALLESLFRQIPMLPGSTEEAATYRAALARLGRNLGRAIYAIDALEDLAKDSQRGDFNPCLVRGAVDENLAAQALKLCTEAIDAVAVASTEVPWQRHQSLIGRLLRDDLPRAAIKAIKKAQSSITEFPELSIAFSQAQNQMEHERRRERRKERRDQCAGCACDCSCCTEPSCFRCGGYSDDCCIAGCACCACLEGCN